VLSHIYTKIKNIWKKFSDPEYRHAFVESNLATTIAAQIETMRNDRGWTQTQLADAAGMKQSRISALEDPSNQTAPNIKTLLRIAKANDVALVCQFVPFSRLAGWATGASGETFSVPSFKDDSIGLAQKNIIVKASAQSSKIVQGRAVADWTKYDAQTSQESVYAH
jgi:HTH-type transcriptional regulator / antitoxin HipB